MLAQEEISHDKFNTALKHSKLAVQWITDHLEHFSPWQNNELSMEGVQALAELAVLFVRIKKDDFLWTIFNNKNEIELSWFNFLKEQLTSPSIAELSRKRPVQSFPYLLPYLNLRSIGWRNSFYEETLEMINYWGFPYAQEVVPFRELDVIYFYNNSGYKTKKNLYPYYSRTFLAKMKNIVFIDNDSTYSITHTILYLSNFGIEKPILLNSNLFFVQNLLESLIVHYWRLGNWDILGELLLCSEIISQPEISITQNAINEFYTYHETDGTIKGRKDTANQLFEANLKNDKKTKFSLCYHTTIVSLLLSLQILTNHNEKNK